MIIKMFGSKFITPVILVIIAILALASIKIWPSVNSINKESATLKQKLDEVNKNITELDKSKEQMQSNKYLEQQARLKLNYKMPDEKVVYIYKNPYNNEPEISNQNSPAQKTIASQTADIWQKIWGWVNGK